MRPSRHTRLIIFGALLLNSYSTGLCAAPIVFSDEIRFISKADGTLLCCPPLDEERETDGTTFRTFVFKVANDPNLKPVTIALIEADGTLSDLVTSTLNVMRNTSITVELTSFAENAVIPKIPEGSIRIPEAGDQAHKPDKDGFISILGDLFPANSTPTRFLKDVLVKSDVAQPATVVMYGVGGGVGLFGLLRRRRRK